MGLMMFAGFMVTTVGTAPTLWAAGTGRGVDCFGAGFRDRGVGFLDRSVGLQNLVPAACPAQRG